LLKELERPQSSPRDFRGGTPPPRARNEGNEGEERVARPFPSQLGRKKKINHPTPPEVTLTVLKVEFEKRPLRMAQQGREDVFGRLPLDTEKKLSPEP